jgi:hypothetical protein
VTRSRSYRPAPSFLSTRPHIRQNRHIQSHSWSRARRVLSEPAMHQPLVVPGRLRVLVGDPGHQVQHVRSTEGHRSDLGPAVPVLVRLRRPGSTHPGGQRCSGRRFAKEEE